MRITGVMLLCLSVLFLQSEGLGKKETHSMSFFFCAESINFLAGIRNPQSDSNAAFMEFRTNKWNIFSIINLKIDHFMLYYNYHKAIYYKVCMELL